MLNISAILLSLIILAFSFVALLPIRFIFGVDFAKMVFPLVIVIVFVIILAFTWIGYKKKQTSVQTTTITSWKFSLSILMTTGALLLYYCLPNFKWASVVKLFDLVFFIKSLFLNLSILVDVILKTENFKFKWRYKD